MIWIVIFTLIAVWLLTMCALDSRRASQIHSDISPQPSLSDEEFCELMPEIPKDVALGFEMPWSNRQVGIERRSIQIPGLLNLICGKR